jgi:hypothetical protein
VIHETQAALQAFVAAGGVVTTEGQSLSLAGPPDALAGEPAAILRRDRNTALLLLSLYDTVLSDCLIVAEAARNLHAAHPARLGVLATLVEVLERWKREYNPQILDGVEQVSNLLARWEDGFSEPRYLIREKEDSAW